MLTIQPGEHGSTYGGNPLACKTAITALQVLKDENMAANAAEMGALLRKGINELQSPFISIVRGRGLLNAIVIDHPNKEAAWDLCLALKENGLLAKPTHGDKIRFAPPLVITRGQIEECVDIINKSLATL
jgi:ornithine--oxo-acid transaminase